MFNSKPSIALGLGGGEVETEMMPFEMIDEETGLLRVGGAMEEDEDVDVEEEEEDEQQQQQQQLKQKQKHKKNQQKQSKKPAWKRQTFIFSATLAMPVEESYKDKKRKEKEKKKKKKGKDDKEGDLPEESLIATILRMSGSSGIVKVVDLSSEQQQQNQPNQNRNQNPQGTQKSLLPPGLTLLSTPCTTLAKDTHLYSFLISSPHVGRGGTIVFVNSIEGGKRVARTLELLGVIGEGSEGGLLHSGLSQKSRLKKIESMRKGKGGVLIATDVAARGLDIPSLSSVVHYDCPRDVQNFVHRSGRTARGIDGKGCSFSLIPPSDEKMFKKISAALASSSSPQSPITFSPATVDSMLLASAAKRVALAQKIYKSENLEERTSNNNNWFVKAAKDADLDLDEDWIDEGQAGGDERERQKFKEAEKAKGELKELLRQPIVRQKFGKFISGAGAKKQIDLQKKEEEGGQGGGGGGV